MAASWLEGPLRGFASVIAVFPPPPLPLLTFLREPLLLDASRAYLKERFRAKPGKKGQSTLVTGNPIWTIPNVAPDWTQFGFGRAQSPDSHVLWYAAHSAAHPWLV